jgi:nucleoid DNA-binding protein
MAKAVAAPKKPLTKSELLANVAAATELSKKQVAAVPEARVLVERVTESVCAKGAFGIKGRLNCG